MKDFSFCLVAAIVIAGVFVAFLPERHLGPHRPAFAHSVVVVHGRPV